MPRGHIAVVAVLIVCLVCGCATNNGFKLEKVRGGARAGIYVPFLAKDVDFLPGLMLGGRIEGKVKGKKQKYEIELDATYSKSEKADTDLPLGTAKGDSTLFLLRANYMPKIETKSKKFDLYGILGGGMAIEFAKSETEFWDSGLGTYFTTRDKTTGATAILNLGLAIQVPLKDKNLLDFRIETAVMPFSNNVRAAITLSAGITF